MPNAVQTDLFGQPVPIAKRKVRVGAYERSVRSGSPSPRSLGERSQATIRPIVATTRCGRIDEDFAVFDAANPQVFAALEKLAIRYSCGGKTRIGIKFLWELLRYEYRIATNGAPFSLDNRYTSRYVRKLLATHPELDAAFVMRGLRA